MEVRSRMGGHRPRWLSEVVTRRLSEEPAVILTGPRTVGKSTLLAALARDTDRPVIDLDQPDARAAAAADPTFMRCQRCLLPGKTM